MSVYRYGSLSIRDGGDYATVKVQDGAIWHAQDVPPEYRREAAQQLAGDEWQVVPKAGALPSLYLLDDLWQALGGDPADFDDWHTRHGSADTWGQLLAIVRRAFRPVCGKPVDGEYCVLTAPRSESDLHECHGPSDVGIDELPPIPAAQPDRPEPVGPESGAGLIAAERARQINGEGRTTEHDDGHPLGELLDAATAYLLRDLDYWPWEPSTWKPVPDDRARELVKAGALIAAEIDRLQRAATSGPDPEQIEAWHNWFGRLIMRMTRDGVNETAIKQASIELAAAGLEVPSDG